MCRFSLVEGVVYGYRNRTLRCARSCCSSLDAGSTVEMSTCVHDRATAVESDPHSWTAMQAQCEN